MKTIKSQVPLSLLSMFYMLSTISLIACKNSLPPLEDGAGQEVILSTEEQLVEDALHKLLMEKDEIRANVIAAALRFYERY